MDSEFLDWALADFSGYVAADELYDGPFCILSAVANRRYKRILYEQYYRQLGRVGSMVNPPEFSHLTHDLINKNRIELFWKPF